MLLWWLAAQICNTYHHKRTVSLGLWASQPVLKITSIIMVVLTKNQKAMKSHALQLLGFQTSRLTEKSFDLNLLRRWLSQSSGSTEVKMYSSVALSSTTAVHSEVCLGGNTG